MFSIFVGLLFTIQILFFSFTLSHLQPKNHRRKQQTNNQTFSAAFGGKILFVVVVWFCSVTPLLTAFVSLFFFPQNFFGSPKCCFCNPKFFILVGVWIYLYGKTWVWHSGFSLTMNAIDLFVFIIFFFKYYFYKLIQKNKKRSWGEQSHGLFL